MPTVFFFPLGALALLMGLLMVVAVPLRLVQLWRVPAVREDLLGNAGEFLAMLMAGILMAAAGAAWLFGAIWCWHMGWRKSVVALVIGELLLCLAIWIVSRV